MNKDPLVSIALCTYNGSKFIEQQLGSVIGQTYQNLEIIIVDDNSTDDTFKIINSYAALDKRIKCFRNEVNLGFNKNFGRAISLTTGNYISICDQDDVWLPEKIELLLKNIGENWLIFSNSSFIDANGEPVAGTIIKNYNPALHGYKGLLLANFITGHTTLFKREFIDYFLPFPATGFYDWWMGFVALYHQKITYIDAVLTRYRVHDNSVIQQRGKAGLSTVEQNREIAAMLAEFAAYKNLKPADQAFISNLKNAYVSGMSGKSVAPLYRIAVKYYSVLWPYYKKRKGLSLLNYALKYVRRMKQ